MSRHRKKKPGNIIQPASPVSVSVKPEDKPHWSWKHAAAIVVIVLAAYSNALFMDFVWDDYYHIVNDNTVKSLSNIPRMFASQAWAGVKGDYKTPYYRPLFSMSLAIDYFVWRENPFGYHLTNILLHVTACTLVYLIAVALLRNNFAALFTGLVFAVHPVHSEAVAWISARNELLCAVFVLLSFYSYILYKENRKIIYGAASLVFFFFGLLSKEMAITLPAIIFLYEVCFEKGFLREKAKWPFLFCMAAAPYLFLRFIILEKQLFANYPLHWRFFTGFEIFTEYLRLLIFPLNQKILYDIPVKKDFFQYEVLVPFFVMLLIFCGLLALFRREKRLFFGLVFAAVALFPVSGIPSQIVPVPMAERYLYIPSIGFSIALGAVFLIICSWLNKKSGEAHVRPQTLRQCLPAVIGATLIVAALFTLNMQRNNVYEDQRSVALEMVRNAPNFADGHNLLGLIYVKEGRMEEGIRHIGHAVALNPRHGDAHFNLGYAYLQQGQLNDAEKQFLRALDLKSGDADIHNNLAGIYVAQGRLKDAEKELLYVIKMRPDELDGYYNLGLVYLNMNRTVEAITQFEKALILKPDDAEIKMALYKARQIKKTH